ncbi:ganglioside GM2 activator-like [Panulirus ornatus]|uniref:ganglioside GM2 activator-like n=1 Tax=Panulirus ornatus TaxID=150431 RepID=UPI003A8BA8F4
MKIQFGDKGEVSWDVLLKVLEEEQLYQQQQQQQEHRKDDCRSHLRSLLRKCCGGSWLTLVLLVIVVILSQAWLVFYLLSCWSSFYTPAGHVVFADSQGNLRHIHFSWSNCGSASDPVQLMKLNVSPDPVMLEGNITLDLNSFIAQSFDAPISVDVKVERHIGWFWVEIPCLDGLGSCHYKDVCELVPFPPDEPCPDPFPRFKLPCRCPVSKGHYIVNNGVFSIPEIVDLLPAWLVSGDYYAHGIAHKDGKRLGCYKVYASVSY